MYDVTLLGMYDVTLLGMCELQYSYSHKKVEMEMTHRIEHEVGGLEEERTRGKREEGRTEKLCWR
jgi:hypothetical protein